MKPIKNLTFAYGRWMTESDKLAITALNIARGVIDKNEIKRIYKDKKLTEFRVNEIEVNNDLFSYLRKRS